MKTYPLAGRPNRDDYEKLGLDKPNPMRWWLCKKDGVHVHVRATTIGEKRPPRAGEWYLSGAVPEAYRTENNLSTPYCIMRLVCVRKVECWEEV